MDSDKIIVQSINGNLKRGGSIATCYTLGDTDIVQYGDTVRLITPSGENVYLIGNVINDPSITYDGLTSRATFQVSTANGLMDGRLQAIGFTEQASPTNSHQITPTMTFGDLVDHILRDHSNLIYNATTMPDGVITDVDIDFNDVAVDRYNVRQSNDFWSTLVANLSGGEQGGIQFYRPYFTKLNGFKYKAAPHFRASAITSKGLLTKSSILGKVQLTQNTRKVAQVQLAALANGNVQYSANYPASPLDGEIFEILQGVYTDSQSRTDGFAEGLYKWLSRLYTARIQVHPEIILREGVDIGDKVEITYDGPTENATYGNGVHVNLNAHNFIVYGYSVENDHLSQSSRAYLELESVE